MILTNAAAALAQRENNAICSTLIKSRHHCFQIPNMVTLYEQEAGGKIMNLWENYTTSFVTRWSLHSSFMKTAKLRSNHCHKSIIKISVHYYKETGRNVENSNICSENLIHVVWANPYFNRGCFGCVVLILETVLNNADIFSHTHQGWWSLLLGLLRHI